MSAFWQQKPVLVTGGAGFLGSFVVERLRARGREGRRPASADYDLVDGDAVRRLLADARPEMVFHLAARVGGIGANRENPGRFLYDNAMMGLQLLEECRLARVRQDGRRRAPSAPIRSSRRCRSARTTCGTATPRRPTRRTASPRRCCWCSRRRTATQYGLNSVVLFPVNLYGPRDNFDLQSSHVIPAMIRKFVERARARRAPRSCCGATARRRASSCTSRTPPRASCWRRSATTPATRSTWAAARRSRSAIWRRPIARACRLRRALRLGHAASRTASRGAGST